MYSWQTKRPGKDSHNIKPLNNIQGNKTQDIIHTMAGIVNTAGSRARAEATRQQEHNMYCVQQLAVIYGDSLEVCVCLVSRAAERKVAPGLVCQVASLGYSMQEIEGILTQDKAAHLLHVIAEYSIRPGKVNQ